MKLVKYKGTGKFNRQIFNNETLCTLEIKIPGSPVPKGTHEWSFPPMILKPSGPPDFTNTTS